MPPAILKENRRAREENLTYNHRQKKMLRPICDLCQEGDNVPRDWVLRCDHDPYISYREQTWLVPEYEDEVVDGQPTGNRVVTGRVERSRTVPQPNWVMVSMTKRINGGQGDKRGFYRGFIRPSNLRNELFPEGIAECCEWGNCMWQQDLVEYEELGFYCREYEAKLAYVDEHGVGMGKHNFEIGWADPLSQQLRQDQLAAVPLQKV
jgi:hypothetical protein